MCVVVHVCMCACARLFEIACEFMWVLVTFGPEDRLTFDEIPFFIFQYNQKLL